MFRLTLLICVALALFPACEKEQAPVEPDPCAPFPCDTCDNYFPPPRGLQGSPSLREVCAMSEGRISPDGRYLAYSGYNADYAIEPRHFPIAGLCVMEIASKRNVVFLPGFFHARSWTPDSRTLYFVEITKQISALDMETKEVRQYPELGEFEWLSVSPSGKYVFCYGMKKGSGVYGMVRWNMTLDTAEFITNQNEVYNSFMVINDSIVCAISPSRWTGKRIWYYNVVSKRLWYVPCPAFGDDFTPSKVQGDLSPDGKHVIFAPLKDIDRNDGYLDVGVWTVNLETLEVRQILQRHPYYVFTYWKPVWSSNSTFIATWFCRKDSTSLLYEYDLTGKPTRQLTKRSTRFWVEN